jgi:FHA domain
MLLWTRKAREASLLAVNPAAAAARELKLSRPESSAGSDESNDLVIRDGTVSRRHALIRRWRGRWQVVDNGSTNGTYVSEHKAVAWITLHDGEELRFGGARFVFRSRKASGAPAASDFPVRRRSSRLRTVMVLVAAGLVSGFAATQYLLYRSYRRQVASSRSAPTARGPAHAGGKSAPVPGSGVHASGEPPDLGISKHKRTGGTYPPAGAAPSWPTPPAGVAPSWPTAAPSAGAAPPSAVSINRIQCPSDAEFAEMVTAKSGLGAADAKVFACGTLTRDLCTSATMWQLNYTVGAIGAGLGPLPGPPRFTPEERRLLQRREEEGMGELQRQINNCQKQHQCKPVPCSELH